MEPYTYDETEEILEKAQSVHLELTKQKEWDDIIHFERVYPILEENYRPIGDEDIDVENDLLRYNAAKLLAFDWSERAKNILLETLDDDDELLVANATDSLYWRDDEEVLEKLYKLAENGETEIMRNYAIMFFPTVFWNIYDVEDEENLKMIQDMLYELFDTEEEPYVKLTIAKELYDHEETEMFDYILNELHNEDSYVRGDALEFLQKQLSMENIEKVQEVVKEVYQDETIPSYKKTMIAILLFQKEML